MKALFATAALMLTAGVCLANPQPGQRRSNVTELLTYTNVSTQKPRCNNQPKIYAPAQESSGSMPASSNSGNSGQPVQPSTSQTFTPTPVVNFYKEFR